MGDKTKSDSIAGMAVVVLGDPEAEERVNRLIKDRSVIDELILLRHLTKTERGRCADYMFCDEEFIEFLEAGTDKYLTRLDIAGYLKAINERLKVINREMEKDGN